MARASDDGRRAAPRGAETFFGGPFRDFENAGGIHLAGSILWCDAERKNGLNFLSSALAGDIGKNRRILTTEATYRLLVRRSGRPDVLTAPYGQPLTVGELRLSLHPAGHVLGSAQLRIEREGRVVVYAGEVSTRPSAIIPAAEPLPCDVLAVPATYARRHLVFPPREAVFSRLRAFVDAALTDRRVPVLLAPPLGIAQELIATLGREGHRLRVHRQIAEVARVYEALGVDLPPHKRFSSRASRGEVLVFPPILRASVEAQIPEGRVALVGPRAIEAPHVHQLGVADAFPLTNVPDRDELLAFVEATGAREVFLTGGAVDAFAEDLRDRGVRAHGLLPQRQLDLF